MAITPHTTEAIQYPTEKYNPPKNAAPPHDNKKSHLYIVSNLSFP